MLVAMTPRGGKMKEKKDILTETIETITSGSREDAEELARLLLKLNKEKLKK